MSSVLLLGLLPWNREFALLYDPARHRNVGGIKQSYDTSVWLSVLLSVCLSVCLLPLEQKQRVIGK